MIGCISERFITKLKKNGYFVYFLADFREFDHGFLENSQNVPRIQIRYLSAQILYGFALETDSNQNHLIGIS